MVPARMAMYESILTRPRVPRADAPSGGPARHGGVRPRGLEGVLPERVGPEGGDGHRLDLRGPCEAVRAGPAPRLGGETEGGGGGRGAAPPAPAERVDGGGA